MIHARHLLLQLKKKLKNKPLLLLSIILLSFLSLLFFILAAYIFSYRGKILPNIYILNKNFGGLNLKQSQSLLETVLKNKPTALTFIGQQQTWEISLDNLKINYLSKETINNAYLIGRSQSFLINLKDYWQLANNPKQIELVVNFDDQTLDNFIATISAQINQPDIPPAVKLENAGSLKKVEIDPGQSGKLLDSPALKTKLKKNLAVLNFEPLVIPINPILSEISPEKIAKTKQKAESLVNKSLVLSQKQVETVVLKDEELINFLDFNDGFDKNKINQWANQLAKSINKSPQNALFRFENNKVLEFKPAKKGITLDQSKTTELIIANANKLIQQPENKLEIALPITTSPPNITTESVNNLGIKELLGNGESWFKGSISSRIHNIKLAAEKINGTLIAPGQIFSFNQTVGDISQNTGFQQAYIIQNGRTVLGDGGGVCQVSTTLFRAALNAGLPIKERKAHAYRVGYYEQGFPAGIDATVFSPTVDLKFKNDTPAYILIQADIDLNISKLNFYLYGTSDGRVVTLNNSRIWDQVPPPPDLYQDDPTLPIGTIKQVDWKAWGAKAAFDWKVTRNQQVLQEKTFYSAYRPWQAVFLKGTKI